MKLSELLLRADMVKSKSEAKRLMGQKAVEIDGEGMSVDVEVMAVDKSGLKLHITGGRMIKNPV